MSENQTFRAGGRTFDLNVAHGVVMESATEVESRVHGSGSSVSVAGWGSGSSRVDTTVTRRQTIFLKTSDGMERRISLTNKTLPCRAGHRLTALQPVRMGARNAHYTHFFNHSTGEFVRDRMALIASLGRPVLSNLRIGPALFIAAVAMMSWLGVVPDPESDEIDPIAGALLLAALVSPLVWYNFVVSSRLAAFQASAAFRTARQQVEGVRAPAAETDALGAVA